MSPVSTPKPLRVTDIGEFIRHDSCERRFKLGLGNRDLTRALPFFDRFLNTMDPVLKAQGHEREEEWAQSLKDEGFQDASTIVDVYSKKGKFLRKQLKTIWASVVSDIASVAPGQNLFWREMAVQGTVGDFAVRGSLDFILLTWSDTNEPVLRVVECKSSRRDRTYHRVQVVLYQILVEQLLVSEPAQWRGRSISASDFHYTVARIDEATNLNQRILDIPPFDLSMERADVEALLELGGPLAAIRDTDLEELPFQLNKKCDGCTFSPHCLTESARRRRLELLSLPPATTRVLRQYGVATLDQLATLDLTSSAASQIRNSLGFTDELGRIKAEAISRCATLPGQAGVPKAFSVKIIPNSGQGQLPEHIINGAPLVRIYLNVDYDYAENRVVALSAHITTSPNQLETPYTVKPDGKRGEPIADIKESSSGTLLPVNGRDVQQIMSSAWTGDYRADTATERALIDNFFRGITNAIAAEAGQSSDVPVHFYVWSGMEMKMLIEACSRGGGKLLGHLRELLGSRQSLEQLLFSSLHDEVTQRHGLGWTGRGLGVVTSLIWFKRRFHWTRSINSRDIKLDEQFTQDVFDFKTTLDFDPAKPDYWIDRDTEPLVERHRFEIRSRFNDSLSAPYWRAYWGELPDSTGLDHRSRRAIEFYNRAGQPNYLAEYLRTRTHALRWLDEGLRKNADIVKVPLSVNGLIRFSLGVFDVGRAGIDFLLLDHHVKTSGWLTQNIRPTAGRVATGRTLPLKEVRTDGNKKLCAIIDPTPFGLTLASLEARALYAAGSYVRVSPCAADPQRGQTIPQLTRGGCTCQVESIDWATGEVVLDPRFGNVNAFTLQSGSYPPSVDVFPFATMDESVTDFVANRVFHRLVSQPGHIMYSWLDPQNPTVPPLPPLAAATQTVLETIVTEFQDPEGHKLKPDQSNAVLTGLATRIHLLQGPPGTGKTTTTAVAVLSRVAARHAIGDVLLISASTHNAVRTLLRRIALIMADFKHQASGRGMTMPNIHLVQMHSSSVAISIPGTEDFTEGNCTGGLKKLRKNGVMIIGGTTSALLKMGKKVSASDAYRNAGIVFQADELIIDEASMLVFPHALALASLVKDTGCMMLTGDHRQLSPIVAHEWEEEDRPPTVLYQPFRSAYDAIRNLLAHPAIAADNTRMNRSALTYSFRLPTVVRELIKRLYRLDNLELEGPTGHARHDSRGLQDGWESVWANDTGLYLIVHNERISNQSNEVEANIIEEILNAAPSQDPDSIAIITPHRAQRTLLQARLSSFINPGVGPVELVDTVNRLQGAEQKTIIVSAAMSDPSAIAGNAEFILELNRANVAFSRTKKRLIVVCAESLLTHMPVEADQYAETLLWKALRQECTQLVATETVGSTTVRVLTPPFDPPQVTATDSLLTILSLLPDVV